MARDREKNRDKKKRAKMIVFTFILTLLPVVSRGIEPRTQGFSVLCSTN